MTGKVGVERLLTVEGSEHAAFPDEPIVVAGAGIEVEGVELFQVVNAFER